MRLFDRWIKRIAETQAERTFNEHREQIRKQIADKVEEALKPVVADIVAEHWRKSPRFRFIKWMQFEMQRVDPKMSNKRAFETARDTLNDHLKDEKIEFGDDRYAWDQGGAIDLIHAYEIEHWERAA